MPADGAPAVVSGGSSLAAVPELVLGELARSQRGVVVLGVDGLSHAAALAAGWPVAGRLRSTFPSTSAPAWLTALTGAEPAAHGVPGMAYRVPGTGDLINAITGDVLAHGPADPGGDERVVVGLPTLFDRAAAAGVACRALAREIGWLGGAWAPALLRGAAVVPGPALAALAEQARVPAELVTAVAAQVDAELAGAPPDHRLLLWVYVNIDDYIHSYGYSEAAVAAVRVLGDHAAGWAGRGWTVIAHSDHGQVACRSSATLARAWQRVDDPSNCFLPSGGAGRVRWLYPYPDRIAAVRAGLERALGSAAQVYALDELGELDLAGSPGIAAVPAGRVGAVVAIAATDEFPVFDPSLRFEHGGLDEDEMAVPLAIWGERS